MLLSVCSNHRKMHMLLKLQYEDLSKRVVHRKERKHILPWNPSVWGGLSVSLEHCKPFLNLSYAVKSI